MSSEFAISTDAELTSLYDTRISRVAQADFVIKPNAFGNPHQAALAAEFINESLGRIEDLAKTFRELLHAIAVGVSVGENIWDRDRVNNTNYIERIEFRHGHRFRYDETWNLRLAAFHEQRNGLSEHTDRVLLDLAARW